jgi:hypothetical protein
MVEIGRKRKTLFEVPGPLGLVTISNRLDGSYAFGWQYLLTVPPEVQQEAGGGSSSRGPPWRWLLSTS